MTAIEVKNHEGYADPTPHKALTRVEHYYDIQRSEDEERMMALIKTLRTTIDLAGFDLLARIKLKSRKTGRVYE